MHVVLFDLVVSGHHLEYASHISRYLISQGASVTFVTWSHDERAFDAYPLPEDVRHRFLASGSNKSRGRVLPANVISDSLRYYNALHCVSRDMMASSVDVIHALNVDRHEMPLLKWLTSIQPQAPYVFGTFFWPYFMQKSRHPMKRIYHGLNRKALTRLLAQPRFGGLFVHSARIRRHLCELLMSAPSREKIRTVPDPVPSPGDVDRMAVRRRLGIPADSPLLLFFGGLRRDKGVDILLDALRRVEVDWRAVIAGSPLDYTPAQIEASRQRLGMPDRVLTRLEFVGSREADELFAAADLVVLPYRRSFLGTSGVLQRAAAAGKPVVATDVGEVGRMVTEHGLGLVVPPDSPTDLAQGIAKSLGEIRDLTRLVEPRAAKYANSHSWERLGEAVHTAYLSVIR